MASGYTGGEPVHFIVNGESMMIRMCRDSLADCFSAADSLDASAFIRICSDGLGVYVRSGPRPTARFPGDRVTDTPPDKVFPLEAVDGAIMWAVMVGRSS